MWKPSACTHQKYVNVWEGEIYGLHQLILHVCLRRGQALSVCVWEVKTELSLILRVSVGKGDRVIVLMNTT